MRVCFVYNAQLHHVPHTLPIALELAAHHPDVAVEVAAVSDAHLDFARSLAERYGTAAPVRYLKLRRPLAVRLRAALSGELAPNKKATLLANLDYLGGCAALVVPERTSLVLKRRDCLPSTRLIYTGHGAGDRAVTLSADVAQFDFVLNAGPKIEKRRLELGHIRPGDYVSGIYAKFDWVQKLGDRGPRLFDNDRPTILYCPHFEKGLSSWHPVGRRVLDWFAASDRYNLVFAPHVRLFEPPRRSKYRAFRDYAGLAHMRIDLGSPRCLDMTYTLAADGYLGDVSSQVVEFMVRPRPCLFLNPGRRAWQDDANYRFWNLGPVLEEVAHLEQGLQEAFARHAEFVPVQRAYFEDSFDGAGRGPTARRGADAIAAFLRRGAVVVAAS